MNSATKKDRETIINILANSFDDNQSVNYIIKTDRKRTERIRALMAYSLDICSLFGEVYLNDDKTACALILYPHKKKTTLKAIWLDLKLVFQAIGLDRAGMALKRESKIKSHYPDKPFYYLWFIGVDRSVQRQGKGSELLDEIIADAESQHLEILLETSTLKNIPWYEKFKFQIYNRIEFTYTLFMLKRSKS